jgi:hypothetical protein
MNPEAAIARKHETSKTRNRTLRFQECFVVASSHGLALSCVPDFECSCFRVFAFSCFCVSAAYAAANVVYATVFVLSSAALP